MSPHAELFQRLDEILVEESPMHPFGCATWMEATQIAVDMAKEALSRPVVHGWPDREAVAAMAWKFRGNDRLGGAFYPGARPSDSPAMHDVFAFADAILAIPPAPLTDGEGE